jgi:hypothetical protein
LNATFDDDDEKIEVGNNAWARCGSENERVWHGSAGDFHSPDIKKYTSLDISIYKARGCWRRQ